MIIKFFKISTAEMYIFHNKKSLRGYAIKNFECLPKKNATINELAKYFPVEDYYRVK